MSSCLARWPRQGQGCLWIGRDYTLPLTWRAGADRWSALPVDLTGYQLTADWRYDSPAGALIATLTVGSGITVEDQTDPATRGRFSLFLPRATTAGLTADRDVVMDIKSTAGGLETPFPVRFFYRAKLPVTQS